MSSELSPHYSLYVQQVHDDQRRRFWPAIVMAILAVGALSQPQIARTAIYVLGGLLIAEWVLGSIHSDVSFWRHVLSFQLYVPCVAIMTASMAWIREHEYGFWLLLVTIIITAAHDITAYKVGNRRPQALTLPWPLRLASPKKTIIGTVAGYLAGLMVGAIGFSALHVSGFDMWSYDTSAQLALVIPAFNFFGDLLESIAKRLLALKTFIKYIPGHECLSDRVDGWLLAMPVVLWKQARALGIDPLSLLPF